MLFNSLRQPHPRSSNKAILITALLTGLAISGILLIFQPFGLYLVENSAIKLIVLAGYGLISLLVIVANGIVVPSLIPQYYNAEKWTLGKSIVQEGALNFLLIGICNFFYSVLVFHFPVTVGNFIFFQLVTVSVGLLPYIIIVMTSHIMLLHKHGQTASSLNEDLDNYQKEDITPTDTRVKLESETAYDSLELQAMDFVCALAADNYVKVRYEDRGEMKTKMMRMTLKSLEEQFSAFDYIVKCHRAYIVNIHFINSFSGNAQGLKLKLRDNADMPVAVSRAMVPVIKGLLHSME